MNSVETGRVEIFVEIGEGLDTGRTGWSGNIELEEGKEGIEVDLAVQCLKGKQDSLKTTTLETKQVLEAKS